MDRRAVLRRALLPVGTLLAGCTGVLGGDRPASTTRDGRVTSPRTPGGEAETSAGRATGTGTTTRSVPGAGASSTTDHASTEASSAETPVDTTTVRGDGQPGPAATLTYVGNREADATRAFARHGPFPFFVTTEGVAPTAVSVILAHAGGETVFRAHRTLDGTRHVVGVWDLEPYTFTVRAPALGLERAVSVTPEEMRRTARRGRAVCLVVSPDAVSRRSLDGEASGSADAKSTTSEGAFEAYDPGPTASILTVIGDEAGVDPEFLAAGPFPLRVYPDVDDDGTTDVSVTARTGAGEPAFETTRTLREGEDVVIGVWDRAVDTFEVHAPASDLRTEFIYSPAEMLETVENHGTVNVAVQPREIDVSRVYMT